MDDVAIREITGGRLDGGADLNRPLRHRLALDGRAAAPFDRSRDAGAHPQMIVRGVADGIDIGGSNVAFADLDGHLSEVEHGSLASHQTRLPSADGQEYRPGAGRGQDWRPPESAVRETQNAKR